MDLNDIVTIEEMIKIYGYTRPILLKMIENNDIQAIEFNGLKILHSSVIEFRQKHEKVKRKALAKIHKITMQRDFEIKEIFADEDPADYFEEVEIE